MRLHIPALLTIVAIGLGSAPVAGQTLADVAKKEEERRKTAKPADKTYTNKDLGTLPPGTPPPTPAKPAASTDAAAKETEKPQGQEKDQEKEKEPAKDQAYWAGRMKELQTQLQRDQTYVDALQTRVNSLATDLVNRDDPAQRGVLASERQKALGELDRLKKQIEATKKAITDLEEEARRANVPPGWLR
jgi:DNA repair exonuclease SbcCD ATPase subunit